MSRERFFEPFFEGKGEYKSYYLPYQEHLKGVKQHNKNQVRSARNEQVIYDMKAGRESRRAVRREARAQRTLA